jgi:hypothetical protein
MHAARFAVYPGVGHTVSAAMSEDIEAFFVDAMPEPDAGLAALAAAAALAALARRRARDAVGR